MIFRKYVSICVLAWDLMEFQLSLTSVPGCNKRLCWLFWGISVLLVSFSKGNGLLSLDWAGRTENAHLFAGENLLLEYLQLWLGFAWSFQDSPRYSETCELNPMAISFHIVNKSYLWFPVLIKQNAIFKTRYILNGGNINNENIGICGKFHNPFRKCLWPRSRVQLYFSWEKNISKKTTPVFIQCEIKLSKHPCPSSPN